jgi:hypothetical protein
VVGADQSWGHSCRPEESQVGGGQRAHGGHLDHSDVMGEVSRFKMHRAQWNVRAVLQGERRALRDP